MNRSNFTVATSITIARGLLCVPVFLSIAHGNKISALTLVTVFAVGDLIDGRVARATNTVTTLGGQLDSAADRTMMLAILAGVTVADLIPTWVLSALIASIAVQTVTAVVYHQVNIARPKTMVGPLVGATLLVRLALCDPPSTPLDIAIVVTASNATFAYLRPLIPWTPTPWSPRPTKQRTGVVANYTTKWHRASPTVQRTLTIANLVTMSRILPGALIVVGLVEGRHTMTVVAAIVFVGLDIVDGFVARALNQVTTLGRYLDLIIDKTTLIAVVIAAIATNLIPTVIGATTLIRVAAIAAAATGAHLTGRPRPRNLWSQPANLTAIIASIRPTSSAAVTVAVAIATQNCVHFVVAVARNRSGPAHHTHDINDIASEPAATSLAASNSL